MVYEIKIHEDDGRFFGTVAECQDENDYGKELLHRAAEFESLEVAKDAYADYGPLDWVETHNQAEPRMWTATAA